MLPEQPAMAKRFYLGLSVTFHDPALAIVDAQGQPLFAEASERALQNKRAINADADPLLTIADILQEYCGDKAEISIALNWRKHRPAYEWAARWGGYFHLEGLINRARHPTLSAFLERYKLFHLLAAQHHAIQRAGLHLARQIGERFPHWQVRFTYFDHHQCHAALACYGSGFTQAAALVVDSFGDAGALGAYAYHHGKLHCLAAPRGLASLGFFYMKLTELCGFNWLAGEEWKTMGLAAYGTARPDWYAALQGCFQLDGLDLGLNTRAMRNAVQLLASVGAGADFQTRADLAQTGQRYFSDVLIRLAHALHRRYPSDNLAYAGGCALNSAANGELVERTPFRQVYIPSAPADDGTALGAALLAWRADHPDAAPPAAFGPYLGSRLNPQVLQRLAQHGGDLGPLQLPEDQLVETVAELLAGGAIVGWARGRAEFGPRALGNRSIFADPRDPGMSERLNRQVKFRESYRPFAPAILHEFGAAYFENYQFSPYMERALKFRPEVRAQLPAVVHSDGTGRLQSVVRDANPPLHQLLSAFHRRTGVPVLLNTSLNIMGKPIVHTVQDAVALFLTSGLDALVLEDWLLTKTSAAQPS